MPTALIVEDEPEANRLLAMLVQLRGFKTRSVFTGGEALREVRSEPPDIIFLDLMLPDINGYEVCRQLKAEPATSLIPVVMVTARVEAENRRASFCIGADDYISKPYTPDQIFQAMADAVRRRDAIAGNGHEGEVRLLPQGDETLRQLARLRNLLVARTPLDIKEVCQIGAALNEIGASAEEWGAERRASVVATLSYLLHADHLRITLRDASDWLGQNRLAPEERWPKSLPAARFDEFHISDDGKTLTFIRRYAESEGSRP